MEYIKLISLGAYALISLTAAVIVGQNLFKNGEVFIANLLRDNTHLVKPINNILLIGFYLVNLAFVLLYLSKGSYLITDWASGLGFAAQKIGFVLVVLGIWHHANIALLLSLKFIIKKYRIWKRTI